MRLHSMVFLYLRQKYQKQPVNYDKAGLDREGIHQ